MRMQDATSYNWFCTAHPERHAALLVRIEQARERLEKEQERLERAYLARDSRIYRAYANPFVEGDAWSVRRYERARKRLDRAWCRMCDADPALHLDAISMRYFMEELGRACKSV